jgi:hypothetical protein
MLDVILTALGFGRDNLPDDGVLAKQDFEYAKERYQEYLTAREIALKQSMEISDRFDKAILALSGGSLGLSLTFLEKLAPHPLSWTLAILIVAWFLLLLSVLSSVVALNQVQRAIQNDLKDIENDYRAFLQEFNAGKVTTALPAKQNSLKKDVRKHNVFSIASLGMGLMWLCVFSVLNLFAASLAPKEKTVEMRIQLPESISAMPSAATNAAPNSPLQQNGLGLISNQKDAHDRPQASR